MDSEILGKTKSVQIRDFPENVWELVLEESRIANETVAQFLTRHVLALHEAGWPRRGGYQTRGQTSDMPTVEEVCAAIEAASKVSHLGENVQLGVRTEANRLVKVLLLNLKFRMKAAVGMPDQKVPAIAAELDHVVERIAAE